MSQYQEWIERTKNFLANLDQHPGTIEVSNSIEPPDRSEHSLDWLRSPENSVPDEIKTFLESASSRACFRYHWEPPAGIVDRIQEIWPGKTSLTGGADLCEQAGYSLFDTSDDDVAHMSDLFEEAQRNVAEMFSDMIDSPPTEINIEDTLADSMFGQSDQGRSLGLVPILIFPDESRLSLDTSASDAPPYPVVHTEADSFDQPTLISRSFQEFLQTWETLCYLTPDLETLAPWLTGPDGILDVSGEKTELLQQLFKEPLPAPALLSEKSGYGAWCDRAEKFIRNFIHGSGERFTSIKIDPPVDVKSFENQTSGFSYQVPDALRQFYLEGSGKFDCTYTWSPDENTLKIIEPIIPYQYTLWGGLELVAWNKLESAPGYYCYWEEEGEDVCLMGQLALPVWQLTVPLIHLGNGDIIGIYVGEEGNQERVIQLIHDYPEDSVVMIAENVAEFFEGLEKQNYLGADICPMGKFSGPNENDPLQKDPEKLRQLRAILAGDKA